MRNKPGRVQTLGRWNSHIWIQLLGQRLQLDSERYLAPIIAPIFTFSNSSLPIVNPIALFGLMIERKKSNRVKQSNSAKCEWIWYSRWALACISLSTLHLPPATYTIFSISNREIQKETLTIRVSFPLSNHPLDVAIASLYLACKIDETIKKLKDFIGVQEDFENHKRKILNIERELLNTILFDFTFCHPHK